MFILEEKHIIILNQKLERHQPSLKGHFNGLVEEEDGSVGTTQVLGHLSTLTSFFLQVFHGVTYLHRISLDNSPKQVSRA